MISNLYVKEFEDFLITNDKKVLNDIPFKSVQNKIVTFLSEINAIQNKYKNKVLKEDIENIINCYANLDDSLQEINKLDYGCFDKLNKIKIESELKIYDNLKALDNNTIKDRIKFILKNCVDIPVVNNTFKTNIKNYNNYSNSSMIEESEESEEFDEELDENSEFKETLKSSCKSLEEKENVSTSKQQDHIKSKLKHNFEYLECYNYDKTLCEILNGDVGKLSYIKNISAYFDFNLLSDETILNLILLKNRTKKYTNVSIDMLNINYALQNNKFISRIFNILKNSLLSFSETSNNLNNKNILYNKDNEANLSELKLFVKNNIHLLSISQLEIAFNELRDIDENLSSLDIIINELLNRNYLSKLNEIDMEINNKNKYIKKKALLIEIKEYINTFKYIKNFKLITLLKEINLMLLEIGIKLNVYEFDIFHDYVSDPIYYDEDIFYKLSEKPKNIVNIKSKKEKATKYQNNRIAPLNQKNYKFKQNSDIRIIIDKYLNYYFLFEGKDLSDFENLDLCHTYLAKLYYKNQFLRGNEQLNYNSLLGTKEYTELSEHTEITICEFNKNLFKTNEDISLTVDIKNIKTLFVKIFEINTENYYLKYRETLNTALDVNGLIPLHEETYSFNELSFKLVRRDFKFNLNELTNKNRPNKRGLFIFEFYGGGLSSRAVVKVGSLTPIDVITEKGVIFYLINDFDEICNNSNNNINNINDSKCGIWLKDKFYKCVNEEGSIFIPFQGNTSNITEKAVIVSSDGFSEIVELKLPKEEFNFKGEFIFNTENIIMASTFKILFKPLLLLNNTYKMDLSLIKDVKAVITVYKIENNQSIPVTHNYDNLKLSYLKEQLFEFVLPEKIERIYINITGNMYSRVQEKNVDYNIKKELFINNNENYSNFFISKEYNNSSNINEYYLNLLGKTGEPRSDVKVNLKTSHYFLKNLFETDLEINTDKNGRISLGKLENIYRVTASCNLMSQYINTTAVINSPPHGFEYKLINITENESIKLPFIGNYSIDEINKHYSFYLEKDNKINEVFDIKHDSSFISYVAHDKNSYMIIKNLKKGTYKLLCNLTNKVICTIEVNKLTNWKYDNLLKSEEGVIKKIKQNKDVIYCKGFKFIDKNNIEISINNSEYINNKNIVRCHLLGYNYIDRLEDGQIRMNLNNQNESLCNNKSYAVTNWSNLFLSNKKLHEEIQYVLDRKHLDKKLGNCLDKPSLLIKRKFIRDTTTNKEIINEGTDYSNEVINMAKECDYTDFNIKKKAKCAIKNSNYSYDNIYEEKYDDAINIMCEERNSYLNSNHNFLLSQPLLIDNIQFDENGIVNIHIPNANSYSIFKLILISDSLLNINSIKENNDYSSSNKDISANSIYEETIINPYFKEVLKNNITMQDVLDNSKPYSENRNIVLKKVNEKIIINDITATKFKIIDSKEAYIKYVALTQEKIAFNVKKDFGEVLFNFDNVSEAKLLQIVTNKFSHELNIYLYFNYYDLFNNWIRPIIKLKCEKTVIDYILLEEYDIVTNKFLSPIVIDNLSLLEKCLLIYLLRNFTTKDLNKKEYCSNIAQNILNNIINIKQEKSLDCDDKYLFNIIMSMKINNENTENKQQLKVEDIPTFESNDIPQIVNINNAPSTLNNNVRLLGKSMAQRKLNLGCYKASIPKLGRCMPSLLNNKIDNNIVDKEYKRNRLYEDIGCTKEYKETHDFYMKNKVINNKCYFIEFYKDLANYFYENSDLINKNKKTINFNSKSLLYPPKNESDLFYLLCFVDYKDYSTPFLYDRKEGFKTEITTKSNCILFTKEIKESNITNKSNIENTQNKILMTNIIDKKNKSHNKDVNSVFDVEENNSEIMSLNNKTQKKAVYCVSEVYKMETILTNISPNELSFELLVQIPQCAIPVDGSEYTKILNLTIERFGTISIDTCFYFPFEGQNLLQYFPSCSINNYVICKANSDFECFDVLSNDKFLEFTENKDNSANNSINNIEKDINNEYYNTKNNFVYLEKLVNKKPNANLSEILNYFKKKNYLVYNNELELVMHLLSNKEFCLNLYNILKNKGIYISEIWQILKTTHIELQCFEEENIINLSNKYKIFFDLNYNKNKIKEYYPVINSRVHLLTSNSKKHCNNILNEDFNQTYKDLIVNLTIKYLIDEKLSSLDLLKMSYYLILQERIYEASKFFNKIIADDKSILCYNLQYDYILAYLDLSKGDTNFSVSKDICKKYINYPILYWRNLFEEIDDQLAEYYGILDFNQIKEEAERNQINDTDNINLNIDKNIKNTVKNEPRLALTIENSEVNVLYSNVKEINIKFYQVELESLFSKYCFIKNEEIGFSYVKESYLKNVKLDNESNKEKLYKFGIPKEFKNKNIFIEVNNGENTCVYEQYNSCSLNISISEVFGEIKVCNTSLESLPKVYVKCYAKLKDSKVEFYKDGYTDLNGKFNYISTNNNIIYEVSKFSIFISHEHLGSTVKECNPPNLEQIVKNNFKEENIEDCKINFDNNATQIVRQNNQMIRQQYKSKLNN